MDDDRPLVGADTPSARSVSVIPHMIERTEKERERKIPLLFTFF
jgi:hypothetical protein